MSFAVQAMERIFKGEIFESSYTYFLSDEYPLAMYVKEEKLFEELSQEDRLKYSTVNKGRFVLTILLNTWVWIEECGKWIITEANCSYYPDFILIDNSYVFDVRTFKLRENSNEPIES